MLDFAPGVLGSDRDRRLFRRMAARSGIQRPYLAFSVAPAADGAHFGI